jgi:hypothetical protein
MMTFRGRTVLPAVPDAEEGDDHLVAAADEANGSLEPEAERSDSHAGPIDENQPDYQRALEERLAAR